MSEQQNHTHRLDSDAHKHVDSPVERERETFGQRLHHVVDGTGKFFDRSAQISATGAGHVGSVTGHVLGGIKNVFVKGWRAYRSHDSDSHTAA